MVQAVRALEHLVVGKRLAVPKMLPIVDNDDVLPDISPTFEYSLSLNFTANGDTVAITKLGIPNQTLLVN